MVVAAHARITTDSSCLFAPPAWLQLLPLEGNGAGPEGPEPAERQLNWRQRPSGECGEGCGLWAGEQVVWERVV